jgi:hypothetical protein
MTQTEIAEFKLYVTFLDASYDELKMLVSFMIDECVAEKRFQELCEKTEELRECE